MSKITYKAASGAKFKQSEASTIGKYLEKLERQAGPGRLTPHAVLEDARDEASPLHDYFTWEDDQAAERWRLFEARQLVNHLIVIVEDPDGEKTETKGWYSIRVASEDNGEERSYASLATVADSPELREQVVEQALREMRYWQMRYGQYQELEELNKAIERAKKKLRGKAMAS